MRSRTLVALFTLIAAVAVAAPASGQGRDRDARHSLRAPLTGENFYFVMADRFENGRTDNDLGGLPADKMTSGFDPKDKGFYHGGDLAGLLKRIDYIEGLGTTAIWLTPSFKNKAVQPDDKSAGYHGYWITDFTQIDPHLGTNEELAQLVDAAQDRGMKVFFDIITNHTADVIDYREGKRPAYVGKDVSPYRDARGRVFDDRDYAGTGRFPSLDAEESFPFTPFVPAGEPAKVPDWLNDVRLYHNRGNTTFVGENSQYGDFFGLDDLFTEHPRVVEGMEDIYKAWIRDFGIDGFRIDTMKHVDDAFWQEFAPDVLRYAQRQGKREFFMFGEVFDTSRPYTSSFTTKDRVQAVLDFPFQAAAQAFAAGPGSTDALRDFFLGDDWYTDADSNAYQLPTFLGNHDMGRIGNFIRSANGGASDAEVLSRDRLAHELMYLSRGNPVIYYGDEQGFVGDGGDQLARQDMFKSQVPEYNDDDLIGTDATTADENFDENHPLYRGIGALAELTRDHPALRNGAQQHRLSSGTGAGVYAFSRYARGREYVVALNSAETARTASIPTYSGRMGFTKLYGGGAATARTDGGKRLTVTVPALSAVVYRADSRVDHRRRAPFVSLNDVSPAAERLEVGADVAGDGFNEVTFLAKGRGGGWRPIGTDDNRPYRVFHDVSALEPGTRVKYRAVVLDSSGNTRSSGTDATRVAPPSITLEAPAADGLVREEVEVRAVAAPDKSHYEATLQRSVAGGPWTTVGRDSSSPAYVAFDDISGLAAGTSIAYRAVLDYGDGTVTSASRSVTVAPPPIDTAIVHYQRADGDYGSWGLHLWGDGLAPGVATTWDLPRMPSRTDDYGAVFEIPLTDDIDRVGFIVHKPGLGGDGNQEPGGDRFFVPALHPEIWLKSGDPAVYFSPPG